MSWSMRQVPIGRCHICGLPLDDHNLLSEIPLCIIPGTITAKPYQKFRPKKETG